MFGAKSAGTKYERSLDQADVGGGEPVAANSAIATGRKARRRRTSARRAGRGRIDGPPPDGRADFDREARLFQVLARCGLSRGRTWLDLAPGKLPQWNAGGS